MASPKSGGWQPNHRIEPESLRSWRWFGKESMRTFNHRWRSWAMRWMTIWASR